MTELQFITAKIEEGDLNLDYGFQDLKLATLIVEFNNVTRTMNESNIETEDMDVIKVWINYNLDYCHWLGKEYDSDMARAMSQPNKPGYYRANND